MTNTKAKFEEERHVIQKIFYVTLYAIAPFIHSETGYNEPPDTTNLAYNEAFLLHGKF